MTARPELSVGLILIDDFTLSALSLFLDPLRLAADDSDSSRPLRVRWSIMSHHTQPCRASCGVMVSPTSPLLDPAELDYLVVVGGLLAASRADTETLAYLHQAAVSGATLVGLCTGAFILYRAGLLPSGRCCVSWFHHQDFRDAFPAGDPVSDRLFLIEDRRITCAGGAGAGDLAAHLVERHLGGGAADKVRDILLFDRPRHAESAQPRPPPDDLPEEPRLRRALSLMEQNLADPLPIGALAGRLGLSARQLERLFRARLGQRPGFAYHRLRLRHADWLLRHTARSVTAIAHATGFADCAHFARSFKARYGMTPSAARLSDRISERPPKSGAYEPVMTLEADAAAL